MLIEHASLGRARGTDAQDIGQSAPRLAAIPTANGAIARAAYHRLKQAGVDARPLLEEAGLNGAHHAGSGRPVSGADADRVLERGRARLNNEFLGIDLARAIELRELGLLYYVQASSRSLGDALTRVARL
jgi:hypothetical protein